MELRLLLKEDLQTRVQWMNNPKVYASMHFDLPVKYEKTLDWFSARNLDIRRDFTFVDDGVIVAFGGLTGVDKIIKKAELYVFVDPSRKGCGLGTKATRLICKYGFEQLGLNKIYLYTNENNDAAIKTYERVGFRLEGRMRDEFIAADGTMKDRLYYGFLIKEWKSNVNAR